MPHEPRRLEDHFGVLFLLLVASFLLTGASEADWLKVLSAAVNAAALVVAFRVTSLRTDYARLGTAASAALIGLVVSVVLSGDPADAVVAVCQVVVLAFVFLAILGRVARHDRVTTQTVLGALCAYVLLGMIYGWTYVMVEAVQDRPVFDGGSGVGDSIYFSYITLTTVGFGDVTPLTPLARRIAMVEAMTGQIFLATLVARMVSMYGQGRAEEGAAG